MEQRLLTRRKAAHRLLVKQAESAVLASRVLLSNCSKKTNSGAYTAHRAYTGVTQMESTFNPIQMLNFLTLSLLREEAQQNPVGACAKFGLTKDQLEELVPQLSPERVLATVANLSEDLLISIRPNLGMVLASPPPLMGALFAVRANQPVKCAA